MKLLFLTYEDNRMFELAEKYKRYFSLLREDNQWQFREVLYNIVTEWFDKGYNKLWKENDYVSLSV